MLRYILFAIIALGLTNVSANAATTPDSYSDQPDCKIKSITKAATVFGNAAKSPVSDVTIVSQLDSKGIYQLYRLREDGSRLKCLTCRERPGGPRVDRNKTMVTFHPSGQWVVVGVEEDKHDNEWWPQTWQRGLIQCGIWLNIWITTPEGDKWYKLTDYKRNPADGFVGTPFTPDGTKAVWAEIIDGNIFANAFGIWKLYIADFKVSPDGTPSLANKRDITPEGAKWVEPGNFSPDGRHLLISADIGLKNAQGQDQWSLDVETGELQNLTNSPEVWDEHGVYSPDGTKITFMSSYPYSDEPDAYKTLSLKTEFMMMDADGGHLQQLTHFNQAGYPESQPEKTIAAVAGFFDDKSKLFGTVMAKDFDNTNWLIEFEGKCGQN